MATDEKRPYVSAPDVFGSHLIAPLPEGTRMNAAFLLVKLDDGSWCARQVGEAYSRSEFLGQLSPYTHALLEGEAEGWYPEDDDESAPSTAPNSGHP